MNTKYDTIIASFIWLRGTKNMIISKYIALAFFAGLLIAGVWPSFASAAPHGTDLFSIMTPSQQGTKSTNASDKQAVGAGALSMMSDRTPIVEWFEKFDQLRAKYRPTPADRVILTRPLMQEEERVKQWSAVANKVAKNYTLLAKSLRDLPTPPALADVKQYRDLTADWYHDAAIIYDDLIRPRQPAKTIEQLEGELNEVKKRSENLAATIATLNAMDQDLRKQYKVHLAIQDDALQQYVKSK